VVAVQETKRLCVCTMDYVYVTADTIIQNYFSHHYYNYVYMNKTIRFKKSRPAAEVRLSGENTHNQECGVETDYGEVQDGC
jgi:hypothetical protein